MNGINGKMPCSVSDGPHENPNENWDDTAFRCRSGCGEQVKDEDEYCPECYAEWIEYTEQR